MSSKAMLPHKKFDAEADSFAPVFVLHLGTMSEEARTIDLDALPKRHGGRAASPFRYPGGKGFLAPFLHEELARRFPNGKPRFAEPYCGGAGAALNLLVDGQVKHLHLNDADIRVYSAWHAIIHETDRFIKAICDNDASIENWERYAKIVYDTQDEEYNFELGFASFFVNRTSRSGVLLGSGPIGGYNQEGTWKIDARYYKDSLSKRISAIGELRSQISLTNLDGLEFCKELKCQDFLDDTFLFIDPPYVKAGSRLYYDGMTLSKHDALAEWLKSQHSAHWLLTYDDHPLVRENYKEMVNHKLDVRYSLGNRRMESELLYMS